MVNIIWLIITWLVVYQSLWKMMEFVDGKDDIQYMKWKIIHSCLKPPTRELTYGFWMPELVQDTWAGCQSEPRTGNTVLRNQYICNCLYVSLRTHYRNDVFQSDARNGPFCANDCRTWEKEMTSTWFFGWIRGVVTGFGPTDRSKLQVLLLGGPYRIMVDFSSHVYVSLLESTYTSLDCVVVL